MGLLTPSAVRKQIKSGNTDPLYLLLGEDDVEKSALAAEFAEIVDEGLRAFNVERIPAGDMTSGDRLVDGVGALVSAVRTLPMMASMSTGQSVRRSMTSASLGSSGALMVWPFSFSLMASICRNPSSASSFRPPLSCWVADRRRSSTFPVIPARWRATLHCCAAATSWSV